MKNHKKLFGLIFLIAAIGFIILSCNPDDNTKYATVKVKSSNNNGIAPTMSFARSIVPIIPLASNASFNDFGAFYNSLGIKKSDITPTKFCFTITDIWFYTSDGTSLRVDGGFFDFATGTTITLNNIPANITCTSVKFDYYMGGVTPGVSIGGGPYNYNIIEFVWPSGSSAFDSHSKKTYYGMSYPSSSSPYGTTPAFDPSWDGNKLTILMSTVLPVNVNTAFSLVQNPKNITSIKFDSSATERTFADGTIIIPFSQVTIPDGNITFNISWNLNGIISQYEGATTNSDDDIYVLKNEFWEGLYMGVTFE